MAKTSASSSKPKAAKAAKSSTKKAKSSSPKNKASGQGPKKDLLFRFFCEQHTMEIKEVSKVDASLAIGYQNPRSEGFGKALKELMDVDGLVTKGSGKDTFALTDAGIQAIPEDLQVCSKDPTEAHDRYIGFIEKKIKVGSDKVRRVWEILVDGQAHSINDISEKLGYKNTRSFGNTKIIPTMKEMELVEAAGKGAVKFTKKVPGLV